MLTSRRVRPGRVRPAVFPYHFTRGSPSGLLWSNWGHFPLIKLLLSWSRALPLDPATTTGFQDWRWSWSSLPCGPPKHPCSRPTLGPLDDGRRVPWWWEDVVIVWLTRDSDVVMTQMLVSMMTWCQDEVYRSRIGIIWADHVSGHISRSYDW